MHIYMYQMALPTSVVTDLVMKILCGHCNGIINDLTWVVQVRNYRKISIVYLYNIRRTKSPNVNVSSRLAVVFAQYFEAKCEVENEDVVGAAPTGDAPTISEWSIIWLPTEARLMLETWRYIFSKKLTAQAK